TKRQNGQAHPCLRRTNVYIQQVTQRRPEPMPKSKPQKALTQLAKLPRRPDFTLIGGKRRLGMYIRDEQKQTYQPDIVIWLDAGSGFIRASQIIDPRNASDDDP